MSKRNNTRKRRTDPRHKPHDDNEAEAKERFVGTGLALGSGFGVGFGALVGVVVDNIALGVSLGLAIGVALGLAIGAMLGNREARLQRNLKPSVPAQSDGGDAGR